MAGAGPQIGWTGCAGFAAKLRAHNLPPGNPQLEGDFHQMTIEPAKEPVVAREGAVNSPLPVDQDMPAAGDEAALVAAHAPDRSAVDLLLRDILRDVLALEAQLVAEFTDETGLFGHLPELDSMAVATLFTEMEDRLEIIIEDDDVDGEMLETYGGLLAFAEGKTVIDMIAPDSSN